MTRSIAFILALSLGACSKSDPAGPAPAATPSERTAPAKEAAAKPASAPGPRALLQNGAFEADGGGDGGKIPGWQLAVGATQLGANRSSTVQVVEVADATRGRVLELRGDASTSTWQMARQEVPVTARRPQVTLKFWHRARGLAQAKGQFRNANLMLEFLDAQGKRLAMPGTTAISGDTGWIPGRLVAAAPAGTRAVRVQALSSMSGAYQVDDVQLTVRDLVPWGTSNAGEAWDVLTSEMAATYPFDPLESAREAFTKRASGLRSKAVGATDRATFAGVLGQLLEPLADPHVTIKAGDKTLPTAPPLDDPKAWNFQAVTPLLDKTLLREGSVAAVRLKGGIGYVIIGSWLRGSGAAAFPMAALEKALDALGDTTGLIIDVRPNMGGDETLAQRVAGRFTAKPLVYAKQRYRQGSGYGPWQQRVLQPSTKTPYKGKVVVLQGRYCMSSNEGFLMMMRALPSATTVGTRSHGASSNPAPIALTSDVSVNSSRWQAALPDGTLIERRGVLPQVAVNAAIDAYKSGDPMLNKALELLGKAP